MRVKIRNTKKEYDQQCNHRT